MGILGAQGQANGAPGLQVHFGLIEELHPAGGEGKAEFAFETRHLSEVLPEPLVEDRQTHAMRSRLTESDVRLPQH